MDEALCDEIDTCDIQPKKEPIYLCKCLVDTYSSDNDIFSERKQKQLGMVTRTENYLRDRRIPELIRFLLTKTLTHAPSKPMEFLEKLVDDCMIFRVGHGVAPVLYENRHLEAVVKSFDPGRRGWLNPSQTRQAFKCIGLTPPNLLEEMDCDTVLNNLCKAQEEALFSLVAAGTNFSSSN